MTQGEGVNGQNRRLIIARHSNEKYPPEKIIEALRASRGMITTAARRLGCVRQTIYDAIARHPTINEVVAGERELMLDTAERALHEAVERGESWAIKFYLATQGQGRGYIERPRGDDEDNKITVIVNRNPHTEPKVQAALPAPEATELKDGV